MSPGFQAASGSSGFQAAVAGGGTVGLACALLLARRCGWKVALVERSAPRDDEEKQPQRALTLSPGVYGVLKECGIVPLEGGTSRLPKDAPAPASAAASASASSSAPDPASASASAPAGAPEFHAFSTMVVWRGEGGPAPDTSIRFDAAELGVAALGYVTHETPLRRALWSLAEACSGVRLYAGAALASVRVEDESGFLGLEDGGEIAAELLIGADGANSRFRAALDVAFDSHGYGQTGLVCEVDSTRSDGDTAWQRFVDGSTLALLPLGAGRLSIVWSMPDERAQRLLGDDDADGGHFEAALNEASAAVAGDLALATPIASFPLRRGAAAAASGERFALIGEAARTVHPLAGQGLNLGLGDAEALARVCGDQGDALIGDARILGRFSRERARYGHEMSFGIHAINAAFEGPAADLAARALGAVDRLPPLKRRLAVRAMR